MLKEVQKNGGFAALQGEKENTRKHENRNEVGPDTAKPVSFELGGKMGTHTIAVLQEMTTKLAERQEES